MSSVLRYWIVIVVGVIAIGSGVGLAMWSNLYPNQSGRNQSDANLVVDGDDNEVITEEPDPILGNRPVTTKKSVPVPIPAPSTSPPDEVPWETGPSSPTPPPPASTGGGGSATDSTPPSSAAPWGTGPS